MKNFNVGDIVKIISFDKYVKKLKEMYNDEWAEVMRDSKIMDCYHYNPNFKFFGETVTITEVIPELELVRVPKFDLISPELLEPTAISITNENFIIILN